MGSEVRGSTEPEEGAPGLEAMVGEATEVLATEVLATEMGEATETGEATGPQGRGGRWVAEGTEEVVREVTEVDTEVDTEAVRPVGARLVGPRGLEATVGEAWGSSRGLEQAGGRWWVHPGMQLRRRLRW